MYISASEVALSRQSQIGLAICSRRFALVAGRAEHLDWTRDPLDRPIVAQAGFADNLRLTRDKIIREQYGAAVW